MSASPLETRTAEEGTQDGKFVVADPPPIFDFPMEPWAPELQGYTPLDPFEGDSKHFDVTTQIQVTQLRDEINKRTNAECQIALSLGDPSSYASETNPGVLFVSPADLDGRTIRGCIDSHEPDLRYGWSDAERETADLKDRLRAGDTLAPDEIVALLLALVGGPTAPPEA